MNKPSKPADAAPITDVALPGKSAPDNTSKAVITNRPFLRDPMMAVAPAVDKAAALPGMPEAEPASQKKLPQPTQLTPQPDDPSLGDTTPQSVADKQTHASPGPSDEQVASNPDKQLPIDQSESEDAKAAEEQAAYQTKLQQAYDSKQYFLPINTLEHRRTARFVALGIFLSLLLAMVWVDIALDARLIHLGGLKPLTHFFSN